MSEAKTGIFVTTSNGGIWVGDPCYIEIGISKYSGRREYVASDLSTITEIRPQFDSYAEKSLLGLVVYVISRGLNKSLLHS